MMVSEQITLIFWMRSRVFSLFGIIPRVIDGVDRWPKREKATTMLRLLEGKQRDISLCYRGSYTKEKRKFGGFIPKFWNWRRVFLNIKINILLPS